MKTIEINLNDFFKNLEKKHFEYTGMFIPHHFIAVDFDEENEKTRIYDAVVASANSYINYEGIKIWTNNNRNKLSKKKVFDECEFALRTNIIDVLNYRYPDYNFKLKN
jgi:hypothetical protein